MTLTQLKYAIEVANAGSINKAAGNLFITQPSLSSAIAELEAEIGIKLFSRNNRGIFLTPEGSEFVGYARQVVEQFDLIEAKYISNPSLKKKFSVSMQHYTFAVSAFVNLVKQFGMDEYEFAVNETKTYDVINDVKTFKSEIGILYINDFNKNILTKLFKDSNLIFTPLMECSIYVYLYKNHPLAGHDKIKMDELMDYHKLIKANDRATLLNLMVGLNGYTLCCGIICEELNGEEYKAVKLDSDERMTIGYIIRKDISVSELGKKYLEEVAKFNDKILE